jgi:hypothetical protein
MFAAQSPSGQNSSPETCLMQYSELPEPRSLFKHKDKLDGSDFQQGLTSTNSRWILTHSGLGSITLVRQHLI